MDDLISRKQAIDYVDDVPYIKDHPNEGLLWKAWLEKLPSAEPERKTGRWIPVDDSGAVHFYKCSRCGYLVLGNGRKYCEDCGAKMGVEP